MSLVQKLKSESLMARKARDSKKAAVLSTLIGDAEAIGKREQRETSDAETTALIKKYIKNTESTVQAIETANLSEAKADQLIDLRAELVLYSEFLPVQLGETELAAFIQQFLSANPGSAMGTLMGALKTAHAGQYDGALASKMIKAAL